jgi:hypothetical protein
MVSHRCGSQARRVTATSPEAIQTSKSRVREYRFGSKRERWPPRTPRSRRTTSGSDEFEAAVTTALVGEAALSATTAVCSQGVILQAPATTTLTAAVGNQPVVAGGTAVTSKFYEPRDNLVVEASALAGGGNPEQATERQERKSRPRRGSVVLGTSCSSAPPSSTDCSIRDGAVVSPAVATRLLPDKTGSRLHRQLRVDPGSGRRLVRPESPPDRRRRRPAAKREAADPDPRDDPCTRGRIRRIRSRTG